MDQDRLICEKFSGYAHTHAVNFHTAYLPYPLYDMHGTVNGGLTTLSRFRINAAGRREYTVSDGFSKYFDLDRCFSFHSIDIAGSDKKLYIVNSHMSAYGADGKVRQTQIAELKAFLDEKASNGDYVIVGGDWNHDLLINNPDFSYDMENRPYGMTKKAPDWLSYLFGEDKRPIIEGYNVVASDNAPSCRNNDIEYIPNETFVCTVDGFLTTQNVLVLSHSTVVTSKGNKGLDGFAYSDHDPTLMEFMLLSPTT